MTPPQKEFPISKPALVILATGIALIAIVLWFGLGPHKKAGAATAAVADNAAENQASTSALKAVPSPATPAATVAVDNNDSLSVIPISLTNVLDTADINLAQSDVGMTTLPRGTQVFGGVEFWLQGLIHLQGLATRDEQRDSFRTSAMVPLDETNFTGGKMAVTERGKNIACIYIIGATRYDSLQPGEKFADVVWHYADGSARRSGLQYDVHLRDWWRTPYEQPAQLPNALTKVAWRGPNPSRKERALRLYRVALVNPQPEKTIRALEFASTMAHPSLFVMALTLDPLMPGARPDDLTSAEVADPELNGQMQLFVQDTEGHPLANSQVSSSFKSAAGSSAGQKFVTDHNGMAPVRFPDRELETLDVSAEHEDFSGRKMRWDLQAGDTLPASHILKLAGEVKIGGVVVDDGEYPIGGAAISLYRFWSGGDGSPDKKGEQPAFSTQRQTTDVQGRWQAKGLPAELLDHIGFGVKHPDFVGTNITVSANATVEKQLREGTHKIILKRGLEVRGRVVDESDLPVSGATVWAGRKYTRERQQTQSDAQGHFSFRNVTDGDTLFSVMAKGHSPDNQTVKVQTEMNEIVFRLKAGNVIRAHVQDESGQPVAGARVGLEGNYGQPAYDAYEFSTTTDSNGDFTWDSAPDETMTFYVFHDGFEAKRNARLAPNQDNTVTLRRSRTLEGLVLDATTEQPVTKFTVRTGTASGDNSDVYGAIRNKDFSAADGRFTMSLEEEADNAVAVYADGYADKIEKFSEAQNGTVSVVVRLKPSASLSGVVLAPDGTPAPGVNVAGAAAEGSRGFVQLTGGRLRSYDSRNKIATTDADGHFKISSAPDDGMVVAAGEPGFARAPIAEVRGSGIIMLQALGRIEGTLKIGGQPGVGKDLLFTLSIPGIGTDFNGYKSTTDDQGQFSMEKIPPGEGAIVRLIKTSPNSWSHSDSTAVTVKPGETTQVTLGDNGAVLVGRARFENPTTNSETLNLEGRLSEPMPPMPSFNSPAEAQAFYNSPEWKAQMKLRKNYTMEMRPDGSFMVDNVAPGYYSLNITARRGGGLSWQLPPVAQGGSAVTVPDSFNPASPIDIGEVLLKPVSRP